MKARLPQGMGGGGAANLQQLARQAQKMQEQMEQITTELEAKEYTAAAGGGAVSATVTGKMEVKNIDIKPEVIDPDDAEMLGDLVAAAVNEALRAAANEKEEKLGAISGGMSLPGILYWPVITYRRSNGSSINLRACRAWGISPHSALRMPCSTWIKRMPKALRRRSSTRTSRSITAPCAAI